jgi:hypothetical protein
MIDPSQYIGFEDETRSFSFIWIGYFLKGKKVVANALVPHQVNGTKSPFAEQVLHNVTVPYNSSNRKRTLYFLHSSPQTAC